MAWANLANGEFANFWRSAAGRGNQAPKRRRQTTRKAAALREQIREEVLREGFNPDLNSLGVSPRRGRTEEGFFPVSGTCPSVYFYDAGGYIVAGR